MLGYSEDSAYLPTNYIFIGRNSHSEVMNG